MDVMLVEDRPPEMIEQLKGLWRRSVEATHDFLTVADMDRIGAYVPDAIASVEELAVAYGDDEALLGFVGVQDGTVEMLFVDDARRGQGAGSSLLRFAVEELGARQLEVNEQNPQAAAFYAHRGWHVTGRRDVDDRGEPFPLLQMELLSSDEKPE